MGTRRSGLDPDWLRRAAARDPVRHAYAVWDLEREPGRVTFASVVDGPEVLAYRLEWRGLAGFPSVHWVGDPRATELLDDWPKPPFLGVVPVSLGPEFRRRWPGSRAYPIELRAHDGRDRPAPPTKGARRLDRADLPGLDALRAGVNDRIVEGYGVIDLDRVPTYGAFDGDRLVAVARAAVTLPKVWVLNGIFTAVDSRSRGFGRAATWAATEAARADGARPALFVAGANAPAIRVYASLGYEVVERKLWIDAGVGWPA